MSTGGARHPLVPGPPAERRGSRASARSRDDPPRRFFMRGFRLAFLIPFSLAVATACAPGDATTLDERVAAGSEAQKTSIVIGRDAADLTAFSASEIAALRARATTEARSRRK